MWSIIVCSGSLFPQIVEFNQFGLEKRAVETTVISMQLAWFPIRWSNVQAACVTYSFFVRLISFHIDSTRSPKTIKKIIFHFIRHRKRLHRSLHWTECVHKHYFGSSFFLQLSLVCGTYYVNAYPNRYSIWRKRENL